MGREGIEPSRPCGQRILSPQRLPFRHRPWLEIIWRKAVPVNDRCGLAPGALRARIPP